MVDTKSSDKYILFFAAATAFMMIGHLQSGKIVRDALFLSYFNVTDLPKIMIAAAVLSAGSVLTFSRLMARHGPARLTPPLYILSGIISVGEWIAMPSWPQIVTVVIYMHITVLDTLLISGFWSIVNECFDPYSAKKAISRIATFMLLGGLLCAVAANGIARWVDTRAIIAMLAVLHLLCGMALYQVTRGQADRRDQQAPPKGLLEIVKRNTQIQRIALLVLALSTIVALLDYLLKATLQVTLANEELVTFFTIFYVGIGIGSLLLQTLVGTKSLRWFGLGGTLVVLPFTLFFGGLMTFVLRSLITVTLLRASATLLANSLFKAGFELLFTPISPSDKRASKILIDVGADRSGDMLGSVIIMGLLLLPGPTGSYILLTVLVLATAMSLLIFLLNRGYISQLADNLRNGTLKADELEIKDATTERTVALTQMSMERDRLLRQISLVRDEGIASAERPAGSPDNAAASQFQLTGPENDPEISAIRDLRSGDENRIRRILLNKVISPAMLPHMLPLFRRQAILREVLTAARPLVSTATGQMVDALLDYRQHPLIRRRIPLLLGQADNERAVQGLTLGLQDRELDVRFRCAEALGRIKNNHPHLPIDTQAIWRVVNREITRLRGSGYKATHGVEPLRHLFNLFGAVFGPDLMNICYASLQTDDRKIRGTALEFLENQLPTDIRTLLWPLIVSDHAPPKSDRSARQIKRDLLNFAKRIKPKKSKGKEDLDDL